MKTLYQLVTIRVKVKQIKLVHLLIFKLEWVILLKTHILEKTLMV
jgi:hypothetical protein